MKFTNCEGAIPSTLPFDFTAGLLDQVNASVESSLFRLRPCKTLELKGSYLDCLILHAPLSTAEDTFDGWAAMEAYVPDRVRTLGISNTPFPIPKRVYDQAKVKPAMVQNRFIPQTG